MSEVRNLILAIVLSIVVMMGWRVVYEKFFVDKNTIISENSNDLSAPQVDESIIYKPRADIIKSTSDARVRLSNNKLHGSILLKGARFDDLTLANYHVKPNKSSDEVVLLSPQESEDVYFIEFGWVDPKNKVKLPDQSTVWQADKSLFQSNEMVNLLWDNKSGVIFKLKVSLDDNYMFKIEQEIENNTDEPIYLVPYGRINRSRNTGSRSYWISHEGAVGVFNDQLEEWTYKNLVENGSIKINHDEKSSGRGKDWIGFADKYWFTALIPDYSQNDKLVFHVKHALSNEDRFQVDFSKSYQKTEPHNSSVVVNHLFTGAKELKLLDKYRENLKISLFDKAVDFGVMYFITKPVFILLEYFNIITGNFGLAILLLTIFMKLIMLPLSNKSYVSMFKLKQLQPQILKIKELCKNDNVKMSKEISALFKKHHVNPMAGFVPVIIQVPLFFALYKVLFVTIEMRHAPFYLWIKDLSSADPTNILTLFGLLAFNPPICIGILPIVLGATMVIQQKLNSAQTVQDQIQASVMKFLPYIFIFIFSSFPAGLVIYWICSNTITIIQQLMIKHFMFKKSDFTIKKPSNESI